VGYFIIALLKQFIAKSVAERILKIGQHFAKLEEKYTCSGTSFSGHTDTSR